jgi:hypothetical protein
LGSIEALQALIEAFFQVLEGGLIEVRYPGFGWGSIEGCQVLDGVRSKVSSKFWIGFDRSLQVARLELAWAWIRHRCTTILHWIMYMHEPVYLDLLIKMSSVVVD